MFTKHLLMLSSSFSS